jgi:hypothetical protein
LETRATGDRGDPQLPSGSRVGELFVFFPEDSTGLEPTDVLEPGDVIEFKVTYHGERAGTTNVAAHVHATISPNDLLPRGTSATAERSVTIHR